VAPTVHGSLRSLPRETFVLASVAFCVALGFGIVAPAIPLFAQEFGVGTTAAGAVVSAFALMRFVFGLAGGRLVDRVGERAALVGGIAVVAVSSLLAGLSASYEQLLVLRGVGGVGSAVFTVAAMSLVLRVAASHQRGQAVSVYRGGFLVGGIAGPAVGGAVLGWSLRAPFFLYAGTLVLAALAGALLLQPPAGRRRGRRDRQLRAARDQGAGTSDDPLPPASATPVGAPTGRPAAAARTSLRQAIGQPAYLAALAGNFAVGFALLGVRATLVPLLVVNSLRLSPGWVGAAFLVSALVQTALLLPAGRAVDTLGRRTTLVAGGLVSAGGLAALAVATGPAHLLGAMAVFGAGSSLLSVAPAAIVGDVVQGGGGTAVAVFQMSSDLGSIVGPLLAGLLVDQVSFEAALLVSAGVVAVSGLLGLVVPRPIPAPSSVASDPAETPGAHGP
jgi:MFS family permease